MEGLVDSVPSIIISTVAMVFGAGLTLFIANRAGIGDISLAVDRENDRLVAKQAERIALLEKEVLELRADNLEKEKTILKLTKRIDDLERLVSDEQLRRHKING